MRLWSEANLFSFYSNTWQNRSDAPLVNKQVPCMGLALKTRVYSAL